MPAARGVETRGGTTASFSKPCTFSRSTTLRGERCRPSSALGIPTLLSIYLLSKNRLWGRGLIAIACVATICHAFAQPVHGVGIALPIFVPPFVAAIAAAIVSWRNAAPLAYAGGSLGVLIGADLLNLGKLQGLGAPVASIGGAGTFDGIFVTGLIAVLLAGLAGRRTAR